QESNVVGKGGSAGFLGKSYDPYTLYPGGGDMDMSKMARIKIDDLQLRPDVFSLRLKRRASLRNAINAQMPTIDKAVEEYSLDENYDRALNLIVSGRAREAFALEQESDKTREAYGKNTFGDSCLLARRLVEAGTRVVEVIWPKVANSDNHSWDTHKDLTKRIKTQGGPMLDNGLSTLISDLEDRGLLDETLVVAVGEFGRSPQKASALPVIATAPTAVTIGLTATLAWSPEQASNKATFMANLTKPAPHLWKTQFTRANS
ncbi:DUF1501 domain-containing protein, partial [Akkermansiaceae bacterium]|nr:DUF1501 domain-containing protein [Akkermansiaceae bacterium]